MSVNFYSLNSKIKTKKLNLESCFVSTLNCLFEIHLKTTFIVVQAIVLSIFFLYQLCNTKTKNVHVLDPFILQMQSMHRHKLQLQKESFIVLEFFNFGSILKVSFFTAV